MDESRIFRAGVISSEITYDTLDASGDGTETVPFIHFEMTSVLTDPPFSKEHPQEEVAKVLICGDEPVAAWHALPRVPKRGDRFAVEHSFGYLNIPQKELEKGGRGKSLCIRVYDSNHFSVKSSQDESRIFRRGAICSPVKHGMYDVSGDGAVTAPFIHFDITSVFTDAPFSEVLPHEEISKVILYGDEAVAAWNALPQKPKKGDIFYAKYAFCYHKIPQGEEERFLCIRADHSFQFEMQYAQHERQIENNVEVPALSVLHGIMEKQLGE